MKSLSEFITEQQMICEHFVNCKTKDEMRKYAKSVWDMLQQTYSQLDGGLAGLDNVDQLIDDSDFWKIRKKNGKIMCVMCYTFKRGGRKACYGGSTGTKEAIQCLKDMVEDDIRLTDRECWAEVSGKMEGMYLRRGAVPIPAEIAKLVMKDKKFTKINPDGYHYTRKIGDGEHEKILVANLSGIENFKNLKE